MPRPLSGVHVDVRTRVGAVSPTTTTGLSRLDAASAATVAAELVSAREATAKGAGKKRAQHGARAVDLVVHKNRFGRTPTVPLVYRAAASVFEERSP
ncbi:MAG TPA: hypothetical protein VHC69_18235 [Polyangiaceae bacterium]|nr:hypothetical protein [Polyangiaceae bacterium]